MLGSFRAKKTSVFFWAIVVLLIIALAGFGIGTGGLSSANVARVGDQEIAAQDYARAYDQELRAITQRLGRPVTSEEGRQFGLDRFVLARLAADAALDGEAARLGLSSGDEFVGRQIQATPAFSGLDGSFDRQAYQFALDRTGLSIREFEEQVRREATRELIAASVQSPAAMPDSAGRTILDYLGERRVFEWITVDAAALEQPLPEPAEADLVAFHDANPARYTIPETRRVTYARVAPETVAPSIEIPEERLRAAYDAAADRFNTPERRFFDRISFSAMADAEAARARLDAGEITFDALAGERGLAPEEIDQGLRPASELAPEAAEAVFGAEGPGLVGPVATPLGPSLFRVNGIVGASSTPFEEARDTLRQELALADAREQVTAIGRSLEDLVAGGATIEEIVEETEAVAGTLDVNALTVDPLAADPAFRDALDRASPGAESDPVELDDGSVVVVRIDEVMPPALQPLEAVRDQVAADWRAEEAATRLTAAAEGWTAELAGGLPLAELATRLSTTVATAGPLARGETVPGAPPELVAEVFALEPGGTAVLPVPGGAVLARLDRVEPFDPATEENAGILASVEAELARQMGDDLLALYTAAVQAEAGVSVNEALLESTLSRFQ
jgi:peptidyl-prolyl cis-trans isomerase D